MSEMRERRQRTSLKRPPEFGRERGPVVPPSRVQTQADSRPDWSAVEHVLEELARTGAVFATHTVPENRITMYSPGRRVMIESGIRSSWVQIEHLRACWQTFERLGRITRHDVMEPGRCSALVMALFAQVSGVREGLDGKGELVLGNR